MMIRILLAAVTLAALAVGARADETLIRLSVSPMPAPKPALRYLLLPELKEMNPGNPIPLYLTASLDRRPTTDDEGFSRAALLLADRAARLDKPDWQILPRLKSDGYGLVLPDVQLLRGLAHGLEERLRSEIARQRFDDAIVTLKTMFALSRHFSEHPTLVCDLVAIAIAGVAIAPLEAMLERPGCPNLYWALTNLPSPLVPLDQGIAGERLIIQTELRDLSVSTPMTADQIGKLIVHIDRLLDRGDKSKNRTQFWLNARTKDEKMVHAARQRLVESGLSGERLKEFPAEQIILLDEKREGEARRDDMMKLMNLPSWQIEQIAARTLVAQLLHDVASKSAREPALFDTLSPPFLAVQRIRRLQAKLDQRIAMLRHVEALRMHAAVHEGKLPAKLADIAVPLPDDPFTGKPLHYSVDGLTAHIRGSPPPGNEKNATFNVHYEVTIKK